MKNKVLETIIKRRSTRVFTEEQVKDSEIQEIIEAGLYAPSAHNYQSWHFTVIQNKEALAKLNQEFKTFTKKDPSEMMQKIAHNPKFNIFYNAPTIILVSGDTKGVLPTIDCAAATQNMLLAAESLGLGSCWNGFVAYSFSSESCENLKAELGIPADFIPHFAVLLGYKKNPDAEAPKRKGNYVNYVK